MEEGRRKGRKEQEEVSKWEENIKKIRIKFKEVNEIKYNRQLRYILYHSILMGIVTVFWLVLHSFFTPLSCLHTEIKHTYQLVTEQQ